jgi:cell wall-associated NlpC family hydrolase
MLKAACALLAAAAGVPLIAVVLVTAVIAPGAFVTTASSATGGAWTPSALALSDIPPAYLVWYIDAAQTCPGLPWPVLAGIGKVETDHGRSSLPGVHSGHNFAGAEGPMQFEPTTFALYETGPDKPLSVYDPADAIYTAARMLCADGAKGGSSAGISQAIFAYNHAGWYVAEVLSWAARYTAPRVTNPGKAAATAIAFAVQQIGKPYLWGGTGPNAYDCSGLVYAAYAAAGVRIARTTYDWQQDGPVIPLNQIQPGDLLLSAGSDGTSANPGHVVMYIGNGEIVQAPHSGTVVQIDPLSLAGVIVATRPADLAAHP